MSHHCFGKLMIRDWTRGMHDRMREDLETVQRSFADLTDGGRVRETEERPP